MPHSPDVAFALHPTLGTVAAVSDGLPQAEAALRAAGFDHRKDLDIFVLPESADRRVGVGLIRDLQTVGYTVAADPQFQLTAPLADIASLNAQVMRAQRPSDVARVFDDLLDDRIGAIPALHQLLETTAEWCEKRLGDQGADLAASCRDLAHQVTELSEDLGFTGGDFLTIDHPLTPPTATAPSRQASRASAATSASPAQLNAATSATAEDPMPYRPPQSPASEHNHSR